MTPSEQIAEKHNARLKSGNNSVPGLREYVDRLVTLKEEIAELMNDIRELKAEAKDHDIDPKALAALAKQKMETPESKVRREAFENKLDSYKMALGLLD